MSFLDKLMFWKKDDSDLPSLGDEEFAFGEPNLRPEPGEFGHEPEKSGPVTNPFGSEPQIGQQQQFGQHSQQPQQGPHMGQFGSKDLEVINAKLDALRAYLDSINQRLANIERIANEEL